MSDSDDTDVLLLIPPNFFIVDPNSNRDLTQFNSSFDDLSLPNFKNFYADKELVRINERLASIDRQLTYEEAMDQDFTQSTPAPSYRSRDTPKRQLLTEIDNYFHNDNSAARNNNHVTSRHCDQSSQANSNNFLNYESKNLRHQADEVMQMHKEQMEYPKFSRDASSGDKSSTPIPNGDALLSLNDLWSTKKDTQSIHEERMRREHCEKTIQAQQKRLFEYEQKIAIALNIDKTKDEALRKSQEIRDRLLTKVHLLESQCQRIEVYEKEKNVLRQSNENLHANVEKMKRENDQAFNFIQKLKEKCELTEMKLENLTLTTSEVREVTKKQIEDLEIRLSNSKQNENKMLQEKQNLNARIEIHAVEMEAFRKKLSEKQSHIDSLSKENEAIHKFNQNLLEKEATLTKELESQRNSLRLYYQKQLEQVVSQKLREFQQQLDQAEEFLKADAHKRERTIAQKAIKQIELLNDKNDQELSLLTEKHQEEIVLIRAQLVNASKTIDNLQDKLKDCKSKRADIADQLHTVMESQWKKTLEILAVPIDGGRHNAPTENTVCRDERPDNEVFQTPSNSRDPNRNDAVDEDLVQKYIDLCLKRSPQNCESLEQFLANGKGLDQKAGHNGVRPPWK